MERNVTESKRHVKGTTAHPLCASQTQTGVKEKPNVLLWETLGKRWGGGGEGMGYKKQSSDDRGKLQC